MITTKSLRARKLPGHSRPPAGDLGILEKLRSITGEFGDQPAVGGVDRPWLDHNGLVQLIDDRRESLLQAGLGSGSVVMVALPNGPEALTAILTIAATAIALPVNPADPEPVLKSLLDEVAVDAVIFDKQKPFNLIAFASRHNIRALPIDVSENSPAGVWEFVDDLPAAAASAPATTSAEAAILVQTTGTTATAKLVAWSQASLLLSAEIAAEWMQLKPSDRALCVMPFSHLHSLVRSSLPAILQGGSVFFPPGFDRHNVLGWISAEQVTFLTAVPGILRMLLGQAVEKQWSPAQSKLRFLASGSDSIDQQTVAELHEFFAVDIREFYGLTEVSPMIAATAQDSQAQQNGAIGKPFPQWRIACLDEYNAQLAQGYEGEIAVRGGLINPTLKELETDSSDQSEGWFRTGDLGWLDEDGLLHLSGRVDDCINRGGQKIAPYTVETLIRNHQQVQNVAVFPIPDPLLGERVAAAVVAKDGNDLDGVELRALVAAHLPEYMAPECVIPVDTIPQNSAGKVERRSLATQLDLDTQDDTEKTTNNTWYSTPQNSIEARLLALFLGTLKQDIIDPTKSFMDLGGDSFLAASLIMEIEQVFGVLLTPAQFIQHGSVRELAAFLQKQDAGSAAPPVHAVQQGDGKQPIFIAHSPHGFAWYARSLAECFEPSQTVYSLNWQDPRPGSSRHQSMEDYVALFIDEIITLADGQPISLVGHSFGAQMCYEIAQQLLARGVEPAYLAIIDDEADLYQRRFAARHPTTPPTTILDHCKLMLHGYVPTAYPGSVDYFQARGNCSREILADPTLGWSDLVIGQLELFKVLGDHNSVMSKARLESWAILLEDRIADACELWQSHRADSQRIQRLRQQRDQHQRQAAVTALDKARQAAKEGDLNAEIAHYGQALTFSDQPYWAYRNLAQAQLQKGNLSEAVDALQGSIQREHIPLVGYTLLAECYTASGDTESFEYTLSRARNCISDTPVELCFLADYLLDCGNLAEAEPLVARALTLDDDYQHAIRLKARLHQHKGNFQKALSYSTRLIADPLAPSTDIDLHVSLLHQKSQYPTAETILRDHIRHQVWGVDPLVFARLAANLALQNRPDEASEAAEKFQELSGDTVPVNVIFWYHEAGLKTQAIAAFRHMVNQQRISQDQIKLLRQAWHKFLPAFLAQWLSVRPLADWQIMIVKNLINRSDYACSKALNFLPSLALTSKPAIRYRASPPS